MGGTVDGLSIHVSQVDYDATPEELQEHFASCGTINRVTILADKHTGRGKGFAYIEFADKEAVDNALLLNDSIFKGRELKVAVKRVNTPGLKGKGKGKGKVRPLLCLHHSVPCHSPAGNTSYNFAPILVC